MPPPVNMNAPPAGEMQPPPPADASADSAPPPAKVRRAIDRARADDLSRNDWYRLHRALVVALQTRSESPAPAAIRCTPFCAFGSAKVVVALASTTLAGDSGSAPVCRGFVKLRT